jgi:hypothetical protein
VATRVNGTLEALAARRASGILEIDGDPSGTVYFDQGQITCARASWIPDIGARLLGVLHSPADSLDLLTGADEPDRDIGTFLIQRNYLTIAGLATILRSVVVDTMIALTGLADADAFVADIRFAPAGAHWAAAFSCLDVASVLAETRIRADRMARYRLGHTTPVRLQDLGRPGAVLNRPQWALVCAIDGAASAQDLAWRCGLALYEAIENLGTLIAAGLCQPDVAEAEAEAAAPRPGLLQAPVPGPIQAEPAGPLAEWFRPVPPQAALPRRARSGPVLSAPPALAAEVSVPDGMPATFEVVSNPQDLLRRVLEGLRRS